MTISDTCAGTLVDRSLGAAGFLARWQSRRDPESGEARLASPRLDENMRGLDILVDQAELVKLGERSRDADGQLQERLLLHRSGHVRQRVTARILEEESGSTLLVQEFQRPECNRPFQQVPEREFMREPLETCRTWVFCPTA